VTTRVSAGAASPIARGHSRAVCRCADRTLCRTTTIARARPRANVATGRARSPAAGVSIGSVSRVTAALSNAAPSSAAAPPTTQSATRSLTSSNSTLATAGLGRARRSGGGFRRGAEPGGRRTAGLGRVRRSGGGFRRGAEPGGRERRAKQQRFSHGWEKRERRRRTDARGPAQAATNAGPLRHRLGFVRDDRAFDRGAGSDHVVETHDAIADGRARADR